MQQLQLPGLKTGPSNSAQATGNILPFPALPANMRNRIQLVDWLRQMAEYIEGDRLQCEPHAIAVVLTGSNTHEVLFTGYTDDQKGLREASSVLTRYVQLPSRAGGNQFERIK